MNSENINEDLLGFLQMAEASLHIQQHKDLLSWLQTDVQTYLPHEVLIAAWGDFSARQVVFDVMSPIKGIRTEEFYQIGRHNAGHVENPPAKCLLRKDVSCGTLSFLFSLREQWQSLGRVPHTVQWSTKESRMNHPCWTCNKVVERVMGEMNSALVHGYADQRGNLECVYVFLSSAELIKPRHHRAIRFLMPYLDHGLRKVSLLPAQLAPRDPVSVPAENPVFDSGLSPREIEIMEWVKIGKTNYEIGRILDISAFTVKNHLQRVFKKLDVSNRAQATVRLGQSKQGKH